MKNLIKFSDTPANPADYLPQRPDSFEAVVASHAALASGHPYSKPPAVPSELPLPLYYHKTSGGAEYLTDKFILCPNGDKEGIFAGASIVVRIDGDITKDAELLAGNRNAALVAALNEAAKQFDSIVSALAQGHTVSISSVQNCAAKARAAATV